MITWRTNGSRSPLGTRMQGPLVAFKDAIQPDGSLLAKQRWREQQQSIQPTCKFFDSRQTQQELDDVVKDKMDGKPPIQAELGHQMNTQMVWLVLLGQDDPNIDNRGKHAKWHNDARGDTRHNA
jgi:hypothetical protein